MIDVAVLQLRLVTSQVFGKKIDLGALRGLIKRVAETEREFGSFGTAGPDNFYLSPLDPKTAGEVHFRKFKQLAAAAGKKTSYYKELFASQHIDPEKIKFLQDIPETPKEVLKIFPDKFVCDDRNPTAWCMSTGTTSKPTSVFHSGYEMDLMTLYGALSMVMNRWILPSDIIINCSNARAYYGTETLLRACGEIGATSFVAGQIGAEKTIGLLLEKFNLPGKKRQASIIDIYPSYLGEIVEYGLKNGYKPSDFGLRIILLGGEMTTAGLRQGARKLFGSHIKFFEGYSSTEISPLCAGLCNQGHQHYEYDLGIIEVLGLESSKPVKPGELGRIVATTLPPYRDTTLVLRYDTRDVARLLAGPFTCNLRHLPVATSDIAGRLGNCVKIGKKWVTERDIAEAVTSPDEVPLPARFGFWKIGDGVAVEVLARNTSVQTRKKIITQLKNNGVPLKKLFLVTDRKQLKHPLPLRCDLKDFTFASNL